MNFDLRLPIGIMFSIFGVIITAVGIVSSDKSTVVGININLRWGIVLIVFGAFMLFSALRGKKNP